MHHEKALRIAQHSVNPNKTFDFSGRWANNHGAVLELQVNGHDLTGMYYGSNKGFAHAGESNAEVKGSVVGDLIAFMVLWEKSGSITQWCGQILGAETPHAKLVLMWRLITELPEPEEPRYFWMSTFAGTDDFTRHFS